MTPLLDPTLASSLLHEHLLDYGSACLYAVLDMARGEGAARLVAEGGWEQRRLIQGEVPEALAPLLPVLVQLGDERAELERFLGLSWGKGLGVLLSAPLELEPLREHLGQQLILEQDGQYFLFRFYDGRVARKELSDGKPGRLAGLFSRVQHLVAEPDGGAGAWVHFVKGGQTVRWDLRWGVSRRWCLGEDGGPEALQPLERAAAETMDEARSELEALDTLRAAREVAREDLRRRLEALDAEAEAGQARFTALEAEGRALAEAALDAAARLEALRTEEEETSQRMKELAGVMGQNTLEVMTAFNQLRAQGARLKRALDKAADEQEREALEAEVTRVDGEMANKRAAIEGQKGAAGQHKELQRRRAALAGDGGDLEERAREASAGQQANSQHQDDLGRTLQEMARGREAMARALEASTDDGGSLAAAQKVLDSLGPLEREAAAGLKELGASQEELDGARTRYNRATADHNLNQRLAYRTPEQLSRAEAVEQELEQRSRGLHVHITSHREQVTRCRARFQDLTARAGELREAIRLRRHDVRQKLDALRGALEEE